MHLLLFSSGSSVFLGIYINNGASILEDIRCFTLRIADPIVHIGLSIIPNYNRVLSELIGVNSILVGNLYGTCSNRTCFLINGNSAYACCFLEFIPLGKKNINEYRY